MINLTDTNVITLSRFHCNIFRQQGPGEVTAGDCSMKSILDLCSVQWLFNLFICLQFVLSQKCFNLISLICYTQMKLMQPNLGILSTEGSQTLDILQYWATNSICKQLWWDHMQHLSANSSQQALLYILMPGHKVCVRWSSNYRCMYEVCTPCGIELCCLQLSTSVVEYIDKLEFCACRNPINISFQWQKALVLIANKCLLYVLLSLV